MSPTPSAPYRLFAYICGLAISFVVLGVIGFLLARSLKGEYVPLIQSHLPALDQIRTVTKMTNAGRKVIGPLRFDSSKEVRAFARKKFVEAVTRNDRNLTELAELLKDTRSQEALAQLKQERADYLNMTREFLGEPSNPQTEAEFIEKRRHYYAALDSYLNEQDALASTIADLVYQDSAAISEKTNRILLFFGLFALWPVLVGIGFFFYGLVSAKLHYERTN